MLFLIWRLSSGSAYVPSPGSVYPTLTLLEELAMCARPPPRTRRVWSRSPTRVAAMRRTSKMFDEAAAGISKRFGHE
jgi:hypothetical protein